MLLKLDIKQTWYPIFQKDWASKVDRRIQMDPIIARCLDFIHSSLFHADSITPYKFCLMQFFRQHLRRTYCRGVWLHIVHALFCTILVTYVSRRIPTMHAMWGRLSSLSSKENDAMGLRPRWQQFPRFFRKVNRDGDGARDVAIRSWLVETNPIGTTVSKEP